MLQPSESVNIQALRSQLKEHPVHGLDPVGSEYAFGNVHRDRATLFGYKLEFRKLVKYRLRQMQGRLSDPTRFLIFGRPRSGTSLLSDLLTQVPDLACDGEVLHFAVASPLGHLRHLAGTQDTSVYGCKLLSYQMFEVQRMSDPLTFMQEAAQMGFQFIHLRRKTFAQTLSLARAQQTRHYHSPADRTVEEFALAPSDIELDIDKFTGLFRWNAAMLDYENTLMSAFPHLRLQYDADLQTPDMQQDTIDRICDMLGHPSAKVAARLQPRRDDQHRRVANIDALRHAVADIPAPD